MYNYLVTYDLTKPERDYEGLYKEIKTHPRWWHYLESTWIIGTTETTKQVYERLEKHIDKDDHILVIEIKSNYYGYLKNEAWEWLSKNLT